MKHFENTDYLCSPRFNIEILKNGMVQCLDKLSEFKINPISKYDINFYIVELFKGVQIFDEWLSCMYDELDDEIKQKLKKAYLNRNKGFMHESQHDFVTTFYDNMKLINEQIRNEVDNTINKYEKNNEL